MTGIAALIVAAGRGERLGSTVPKQFLPLMGTSLLRRSVELFSRCADIGLVQIVIGEGQEETVEVELRGLQILPAVRGGASRQESVRRGLEALAAYSPDFVFVHDAARPFASPALIARAIEALKAGTEAAVPLVPLADTLKRAHPGDKWSTHPREGLFRAQTPQGFRFSAILRAHREHTNLSATDDMALAEAAGLSIAAIPGEETNLKITTAGDLALAEKLAAGTAEYRTGYGFDAHRFAPGDRLWLCGVSIAHDKALEGHSDADAGLHALTDAILGTIGAGDIGKHFPPTDEKWRGAPSSRFLAHAAKLVDAAGGAIVHCDVTLICERPKIAPHREVMRARIAEILKLDIGRISVKATTTEGMGFIGRGEGLAAQAVATIRIVAA